MMMMVQLLSWLLTWKASVRKIDDFRRRGRELMASGVMQVRKRAVRKIFGGGGSHTCKNSTNVVITPLIEKESELYPHL